MATIKAIEGRSVHQIQSGQVIVDLCSVIKELVENSLDAGATSIEVRLKHSGLDSIEVQDNGEGISKSNYENIALKHYTSKLSDYSDLTSLRTFGFRGEALSSLCALSNFRVITAQANEAPRGTRLEFATSGKLKGTQVVAAQRGTTVTVDGLFQNLPVRRRELEKNVKREYGKVLGLLHAYACVSTGVRFVVSNQTLQGKKAVVFATKANPTTRENIANVFGAKTLSALMTLDVKLELQSKETGPGWSNREDESTREVHIVGHVSRPGFGEGRQTPDRQMFFVNSRPCGLPQVAKAFNEVYKSYNLSQSPFIFADLRMDTNSYDVNVSPDKRTILLQDQNALLEALKESLKELFESQDQTMPQIQLSTQKVPAFKQLTLNRERRATSDPASAPNVSSDEQEDEGEGSDEDDVEHQQQPSGGSLIQNFLETNLTDRRVSTRSRQGDPPRAEPPKAASMPGNDRRNSTMTRRRGSGTLRSDGLPLPVQDFNQRIAEQEEPVLTPPDQHEAEAERGSASRSTSPSALEEAIPAIVPEHRPRMGQNTLRTPERMRLRRGPEEMATITIGTSTTRSPIGTPGRKRQKVGERPGQSPVPRSPTKKTKGFGRSLKAFTAPGTQAAQDSEDDHEEEEEEDVTMRDDSAEESSSPALPSDNSPSDAEDVDDVDVEELSGSEATAKSSDGQESSDPDAEYLDEEAKKSKEDARVQRLIQDAEEDAARPTVDNDNRAHGLLSSGGTKASTGFSTHQLVLNIDTSVSKIEAQFTRLHAQLHAYSEQQADDTSDSNDTPQDVSAEEHLSLTVSKSDFLRMRIIGQFNLGFILATRPSPTTTTSLHPPPTDLFIIDQHASDEKYNFERLQRTTVMNNQRLVHPLPLSLTAIEEELILEHLSTTLAKNGFVVDLDDSGDEPVGQRCKLLALPTSREVVFTERDLEELLALLADAPAAPAGGSGGRGGEILRPTKARKLLAMRACRSSIMIGRPLTKGQMVRCVRHMGEIDKPWNCPHGRPTMRHLVGLKAWEGWKEDED